MTLRLAPRRLERRRLLDAAAPALAIEMLCVSTEFIEHGDDNAALMNADEDAAAADAPPMNLQILPVASIAENGVVALELLFEDIDLGEQRSVEVDWGDGSVEVFNVPSGSQTFGTIHQYLDDPGGATTQVYTIGVRVLDANGTSAATSSVVVSNIAPSNLQIAPIGHIDEHGAATLSISFDDPGGLDSHAVEVDWGDGSIEVYHVPEGSRLFGATHQYLDDAPSGTASGEYLVNVRVADDDGGEIAGSSSLTVSNVAPDNILLAPIATLNENGVATLDLSFDDPGMLDMHLVEIDWGDGSAVETLMLPVGSRTLSTTHQYLDDSPIVSPADSYTIAVRVVDDDLGVATASIKASVRNVAPNDIKIDPVAPIDENGTAVLNIAFSDPGTLDTHTIEVDWGDGAIETLAVPPGARTMAAAHQYLENHSAAAANGYTARVTVRDDDGGLMASAATSVVRNVAPMDLVLTPISPIDENGAAILNLSFTDPGSLDSHTVAIDWGDGAVEAKFLPAGARTLSTSHQYLDDNPSGTPADTYAVRVWVVDDDGGYAAGATSVIVNNVAPTNLQIIPAASIVDEGSLATLDVTFDDPGGQDSHVYEINWGDGRVETSVPVGRSFTAAHVYGDNGAYAVTVTLADDDGGVAFQTIELTVLNVDPTLGGVTAAPTVDEGAEFTLGELGVHIRDPGFDLSRGGGGSKETFVGDTVDWGDGTPIESLAIGDRVSGEPGRPTVAQFSHAPHTYADNGEYVVTLRFRDDDGELVTRTFSIAAENVAPTLVLTQEPFVIREGDLLTIPSLGAFSDPGFDNPNRPGGGSSETFTFTISWGDGTPDDRPMPASRTNGSAGTPTTGTIAGEHRYEDNDADNRYTITVTLTDDDGGQTTQSIEVIVRNVNPTITAIAATDVNNKGETTLTFLFNDPGADAFTFMVDWGDRLHLPPSERFVLADARDGPTPQTIVLTHKYDGPPNLDNPSADITITVKVRDDDFGIAGVVEAGESLPQDVEISQPGIGAERFRIDTTPQVALLAFPDRTDPPTVVSTPEARAATSTIEDEGGASGESFAATERYYELRIINPDGSNGPGFRLPSQVLSNLPAFFRNLPDNHYAIYLVQPETGARRLVIEVFVRNGKLIDPGDDTEGARDRPPTDESISKPAAEEPAPPAPLPTGSPNANGEAGSDQDASVASNPLPSSAALYHRATLAGVALALTGAGRKWHRQLERALIRAKPEDWKRLRTAGNGRPRKPR